MAAREPGDVHTHFFDAFNAKDLDALVSLYEPDSLLATPDGRLASGIDAIKAGLETALTTGRTFQHRSQVVHQSGDIAVLDTKSTITDTAPDGTVTSRDSVSIEVVRRQADGSWKFVVDLPGR